MNMRTLFWPIAVLRGWQIRLRNHLFDLRIWKSVSFEKPLIYIGGIDDRSYIDVAILVRDVLIGIQENVSLCIPDLKAISDQNRLISGIYHSSCMDAKGYHFFSPNGSLVLAVSEWYQFQPEQDVVLMSDMFEMNEIRPSIRILAVDYTKPFFDDSLWPMGKLKECKSSSKMADFVLVNRYIDDGNCDDFLKQLNLYLSPGVQVFFIKEVGAKGSIYNSANQIEIVSEHDNFTDLLLEAINTVKSD